ncbi:MAG: hypothetical protein ACI92Z_000867 [Paracoccaceae bacterium]|jgi:hypothetical protein
MVRNSIGTKPDSFSLRLSLSVSFNQPLRPRLYDRLSGALFAVCGPIEHPRIEKLVAIKFAKPEVDFLAAVLENDCN